MNPSQTEMIVRLANSVLADIKGLNSKDAFQIVKEIIRTNEIVFAVWQDETASDGVGMKIVKGEQILEFISDSNVAEELVVGAVPCDSQEQAVALKQTIEKGEWFKDGGANPTVA